MGWDPLEEPPPSPRGCLWGFYPSLRQANGQGWGYRIMTPPEGPCTMWWHLHPPTTAVSASVREPQHLPFCLQHPCVPISKTPMFHVPLSRAPSSRRALGGPRPIVCKPQRSFPDPTSEISLIRGLQKGWGTNWRALRAGVLLSHPLMPQPFLILTMVLAWAPVCVCVGGGGTGGVRVE